jgi:hypothetical protein
MEAMEKSSGQASCESVLYRLQAFILRLVSLSESQARIVALWVVDTHVFSDTDATPYLANASAEKHSGKSQLLEALDKFVANPWFTGRVKADVLISKIDGAQPTIPLARWPVRIPAAEVERIIPEGTIQAQAGRR